MLGLGGAEPGGLRAGAVTSVRGKEAKCPGAGVPSALIDVLRPRTSYQVTFPESRTSISRSSLSTRMR